MNTLVARINAAAAAAATAVAASAPVLPPPSPSLPPSLCSFVPLPWLLKFFVRKDNEVFKDEVLWDVANPVNGADPYAVRVCCDLGLGADWFDAIRAHVQQQLDDVKQVG
jgi:hypothetical protein